jgi:primosomal protein N' (replication factor Y)
MTRTNADELKPLLICHHCGQKLAPPSLCPKCNGYRIKTFGTGTQRVEIEAKKIFRNAKILRLDSDVVQTSAQQSAIIQNFRQKKADILIGTQMILNADLPKVPLTAIISADTLLHLPDFQSDEKTLQTINKVKNFTNSQLLIQTYNPQAQILQIALGGDLKYFYDKEIETRQALKYPPFSQLIKLVFGDRDPKKAAEQAKILHIKLTQQLKNSKILKEVIFEISEPLPAFITKERGKYIWQIILKIKPYWLASKSERQNLLALRNKFLLTVPPFWQINVDPETLL